MRAQRSEVYRSIGRRRTRTKKLEETAKEVAEGEMPPWFYVMGHRRAALSPADAERLRAWTAEEMANLGR